MKGFDSKSRRPGRYNPNYHPSGKGTYNCRWRKEERRERAVARQKALCESRKKVTTRRGQHDPEDWREMLPKDKR